ncbi:glutamate synthase-related protein [Candidatus Steffania adelgidicola]|uniref:glutamate synthase-related protein n=1 Tax=Candidatus Steffania adelgidicola TaxID=1076626 RepID=UPI002494F010
MAFKTAPMVALGCKYSRIYHLNNCATVFVTQNEDLRRNHYHYLPECVRNYFLFIAQKCREIMVQLGVTQLVDLIGCTDFLRKSEGMTTQQNKLDLSLFLVTAHPYLGQSLYCTENRNSPLVRGFMNNRLNKQVIPYVDTK